MKIRCRKQKANAVVLADGEVLINPVGGDHQVIFPGRFYRIRNLENASSPASRRLLKQFTPNPFLPIIDGMESQLGPEVRLRAEENGPDVDVALDRFRDDIESLKRHLEKRREFILSQDELKMAN